MINCPKCSRELLPDSRFCDWCGYKIEHYPIFEQNVLNKKVLVGGLAFSVLLTFIISSFAGFLGLPLLFGGLFLPFLWNSKKNEENK